MSARILFSASVCNYAGLHGCEATALEDSEAWLLPFQDLEILSRSVAPLQQNLHRFLSREISRDHSVMLLLGGMRAEERLAAFLLNLSQRVSRAEIGSYLGLKRETVSLLSSRFQQEVLLQCQGRSIMLLDIATLMQLRGQRC